MRNEIVNTNDKLMTTKELATMLNTTKDVILSNGKNVFRIKLFYTENQQFGIKRK